MKTTVKVFCDTGNSWVTAINLSLEEAENYFMGQKFTREDDSGHETVDTVIRVEQVQS